MGFPPSPDNMPKDSKANDSLVLLVDQLLALIPAMNGDGLIALGIDENTLVKPTYSYHDIVRYIFSIAEIVLNDLRRIASKHRGDLPAWLELIAQNNEITSVSPDFYYYDRRPEAWVESKFNALDHSKPITNILLALLFDAFDFEAALLKVPNTSMEDWRNAFLQLQHYYITKQTDIQIPTESVINPKIYMELGDYCTKLGSLVHPHSNRFVRDLFTNIMVNFGIQFLIVGMAHSNSEC